MAADNGNQGASGRNGHQVASSTRRNVARVGVTALLVLTLGAIAPDASPQELADTSAFLSVFDDPTSLAIEIDQRVSSEIASCMTAQGQPYVVAPNARFEIAELTIEGALNPALERSFGDLLPQLVDPSQVAINPQILPNPNQVLINPNLIDSGPAQDLVRDDVLLADRTTDIDMRLQPELEGYGVAFTGYELAIPDPNQEIVEGLTSNQLNEYEIAFYGTTLEELPEATTGGCAQRGVDVLEDEIIPELMARDAELEALQKAIIADPGYVDAEAQWRQCMTESGVEGSADVQSPDQAVAITQERFLAAGNDRDQLLLARQFEIELAKVDFDCRARSTDLAITAVVARVGEAYVSGIEGLVIDLGEGR